MRQFGVEVIEDRSLGKGRRTSGRGGRGVILNGIWGHGFRIFGWGYKGGFSEGDGDVTRQGIESVVLNRVCTGGE